MAGGITKMSHPKKQRVVRSTSQKLYADIMTAVFKVIEPEKYDRIIINIHQKKVSQPAGVKESNHLLNKLFS